MFTSKATTLDLNTVEDSAFPIHRDKLDFRQAKQISPDYFLK